MAALTPPARPCCVMSRPGPAAPAGSPRSAFKPRWGRWRCEVCVALVRLKQSTNLCVRCKTTNCVCTGGRAGSSRENAISPWNTGVTPTLAVPEGAGEELFTFSL